MPHASLVQVDWEAQPWLKGDQFDGVMTYQLMQACLGFFSEGNINRAQEKGIMGLPDAPFLDAAGFSNRVMAWLSMYPL